MPENPPGLRSRHEWLSAMPLALAGLARWEMSRLAGSPWLEKHLDEVKDKKRETQDRPGEALERAS